MRQGAPLAAGTIQVQNGIDHFAHLGGTRAPIWLGGWNEWLADGPFLLTQIAWIASEAFAHSLLFAERSSSFAG